MATPKYEELVHRLVDKTNRNQLDWKESPLPESYQVSFSNYSISISEESSQRGGLDYMISIRNAEGTILDKFSDADLGSDYFELMRNLFQDARRQALGVDKALDDIFKELDDIPPF